MKETRPNTSNKIYYSQFIHQIFMVLLSYKNYCYFIIFQFKLLEMVRKILIVKYTSSSLLHFTPLTNFLSNSPNVKKIYL